MNRAFVRGALALGLASALGACGGGGSGGGGAGGDPPAVSDGGAATSAPGSVPASALQTWAAMLAYMKSLAGDDASEPLVIPQAPPVDDTVEPSPLS